ncbi:MAG: hypothetical protein K1X79_10825 [Oligoflexia bacterium]|nr:hypothetical protein [Oligoflexia bacterium]
MASTKIIGDEPFIQLRQKVVVAVIGMSRERQAEGSGRDRDGDREDVAPELVERLVPELRALAAGKDDFRTLHEIANELEARDIARCCADVRAFVVEPEFIANYQVVDAIISIACYLSEHEEDLDSVNRLFELAECLARSIELPGLEAEAMLERAENLDNLDCIDECAQLIRDAFDVLRKAKVPLQESSRAFSYIYSLTTLLEIELEKDRNDTLTEATETLRALISGFPACGKATVLNANAACMRAYARIGSFEPVDDLFRLAQFQVGLDNEYPRPIFADLCTTYADCLMERGRAVEARPILERGIELLRGSSEPRAKSFLRDALLSYVDCLSALGEAAEVLRVRAQLGIGDDLEDDGDSQVA